MHSKELKDIIEHKARKESIKKDVIANIIIKKEAKEIFVE